MNGSEKNKIAKRVFESVVTEVNFSESFMMLYLVYQRLQQAGGKRKM